MDDGCNRAGDGTWKRGASREFVGDRAARLHDIEKPISQGFSGESNLENFHSDILC